MATLQQIMTALPKADAAGDSEAVGRLSDAMRAHPTFQQNAKEGLESGGFKLADDGFTVLGKDEQRAKMSKGIARSMGLRDSDVDVTEGMDTYGRFKLSFQPTEQDKVKHLEDTYGRENIRAVDIGGKMKLLYRDEQETGNQFRAVDEEGTSLADFFGDTAGEVLPTAGAIAGGVAGFATAGPVGAVAGAAVGGAAARGAQDITTRAVSGEEQQFGEMGGRLAKEAVVGAVFDTATLGASRFLRKPLLKAIGKTPASQGIMDSMDSLRSGFGAKLDTLPSMTKDIGARDVASRRAGETAGSMTRAMQSNIDEYGRVANVINGTEAPTNAAEAIQRMQGRIKEGYDADIAEVAKLSGNITEAYKTRAAQSQQGLQTQLDNEMSGFRLPREFDPEVAGAQLQDGVNRQFAVIRKATKQKYESGLSEMARKGTSTDGSSFADAIATASKKSGGVENIEGDFVEALSSSTGKQLERSMKNHLEELADSGKRVSYQEVHDVVQKFKNKMNFDETSTNMTPENIAASNVVKELTPLLQEMRKSNPAADQMIKKADEFFKEKNLPFRNKDIASLIKRDVTQTRMAPSNVAKSVFTAPRNVRSLLDNAGGMKAEMKKTLSNMYLDAMGTSMDFDVAIARELFSSDKVAAMSRIRTLQRQLKVPAAKIKEGDLEAMVNGLSGKARTEAEKSLADKIKAEARASKLISSNGLIKKIADGKAPMPSEPRQFAVDVLKEKDPEVIRAFVKRLDADPAAQKSLRAGVVEEFREAIGFGGTTAQKTSVDAGEALLWKAGDVEKLLSSSKGAKYKAAMGDEWSKNWTDLDRALQGSEITGTPIKEQVRAVFTTGTGLLIVAAGIPKWAFGRAMNAIGGSRLLRPFLQNVEQDPAVMKQLIPYLLGTSEGMAALIEEGRNDPDFAELIESQIQEATASSRE